jgi:hypothetical protein
MFINYTPFDGYCIGAIDSARVAVNDIAQIIPVQPGDCSQIILKSSGSVLSVTNTREIYKRIEAQNIWQARWQYFKHLMTVTKSLGEADNKTIDNDQGLQVMDALLQQMNDIEQIEEMHLLRIKQ